MEKVNMRTKNTPHGVTNYITFAHYYDWLRNIATNIFQWEGLPEYMPKWAIEHFLFEYGTALFFSDPEKGFLVLRGTGNGTKSVYGEDIAFQVNAYNYHTTRTAMESVLIWNNNTKSPTEPIIRAFAARLASVERVTDTNMNAQKTPVLLVGEEKNILTLKNIYRKYEGNEPVIYGDKNYMNNQSIQAISTLAPYIIDKLDVHKQNLWNEALTFLGIQNANTDKRERLITDEVNANNEHIKTNLDVMLNQRQQAAERINKMFGQNISVRVRGGEEDESVHDRTEIPDPAEL